MSFRSAVAIALLVTAGPLGAHADQDEHPDWVLVRIEAGPDTIDGLRAGISGTATVRGDEPTVAGFGYADRSSRLLDVIPLGSGPLAVTTTAEAGGIDLAVLPSGPTGSRHITATLVLDGPVAARSAVSFLVFVPGMHFESLHVDEPTTTAGELSWRMWTGAGSATARAADPGDDGTGAAAGPAAAAVTSTHTREVDRGLVGAFMSGDFCIACWGTWASPTGTAGSYSTTPAPEGSPVFTGPAGTWSWTWSGAAVTRSGAATAPVILAYAPVDDIWPIFAPLGG